MKPVRVRAKITRMGDKVHIIIPKAYYKDIQKMIDKFVDVDIIEV
jgi:antitoxin component of MazEF toxin-antitoxin module